MWQGFIIVHLALKKVCLPTEAPSAQCFAGLFRAVNCLIAPLACKEICGLRGKKSVLFHH